MADRKMGWELNKRMHFDEIVANYDTVYDQNILVSYLMILSSIPNIKKE